VRAVNDQHRAGNLRGPQVAGERVDPLPHTARIVQAATSDRLQKREPVSSSNFCG
jgi:hypothetical protein